jgi:type III restriction enzyme
MATGSGKTVIMASLILYYYKQGYRNFLFFVRNINIIDKTIENFTKPLSSKYLFSNPIEIDGKQITINKVENFQRTDADSINICFTSNAGLQNALGLLPRENALSMTDFEDNKIVMIADESHHLNANTKNGTIEFEDEEDSSWEGTVMKAFHANKDNVLLEFTATCDIKNPFVQSKYQNVIVFDYPLSKFREDKYSKDIMSLPSTDDMMERAFIALLISEYRYKLFQKYKYNIKPVVMFKSKSINESRKFYDNYLSFIREDFSESTLIRIRENNKGVEIIERAFRFFDDEKILIQNIVNSIKLNFSEEHCKLLDSSRNKITAEDAVLLNSLEEPSNPYRLIFVVDMLNEGWDVLNLFDIVRLYNERQGAHGKSEKVSKYTISEAQLIGRGARYFPFKIEEWQEINKRKYDNEINNPLRLCEMLIYHCTTDSKYINEIRTALREIGLVAPTEPKKIELILKDSFKAEKFYKNGYVFVNNRKIKSRSNVNELPDKLRSMPIEHSIISKASSWIELFGTGDFVSEKRTSHTYAVKELPFNVLFKGIRQFPSLQFNKIITKFPNIHSIKEFLSKDSYLGNMKIKFIYPENYSLSNNDFLNGYLKLLNEVSVFISKIEIQYEGTETFKEDWLKHYIKDTVIFKELPTVPNGGEGFSQNDSSVPAKNRLDLSNELWYAFNDNYGTSEEKSFVKYFSSIVDELSKKYNKVFLIRNEQKIGIYSFISGERFEPDYLLYLGTGEPGRGTIFYQIFAEPKGDHLLLQDEWKEKLLLEIASKNLEYEIFLDSTKYKIWGLPFYNENNKLTEFDKEMRKLL